jgi:hypothetical protein
MLLLLQQHLLSVAVMLPPSCQLQQLPLVHCICISPFLPCVCCSHSFQCHLSAIHSSAASVVTVSQPLVTTTVCYSSSLLPPGRLCCLLSSAIQRATLVAQSMTCHTTSNSSIPLSILCILVPCAIRLIVVLHPPFCLLYSPSPVNPSLPKPHRK